MRLTFRHVYSRNKNFQLENSQQTARMFGIFLQVEFEIQNSMLSAFNRICKIHLELTGNVEIYEIFGDMVEISLIWFFS